MDNNTDTITAARARAAEFFGLDREARRAALEEKKAAEKK